MEHPGFSSSQAALTETYDQIFRSMDYFDEGFAKSGFLNLGLFLPDTPDHTAACENLMERLLGLVVKRRGQVLDVGCGLGGPTKYLTRYYSPARVHGVNISAYQLEICRRRAPDSHFHLMAAERLEFADNTFDTVVSVEAAAHFNGHREFLRGAHRVLKPGSELAVADILFHTQPESFPRMVAVQELYRDIGEYRALWQACGFCDLT